MHSHARTEARHAASPARADRRSPAAVKPIAGLPAGRLQRKCACGGGCSACAGNVHATPQEQQAHGYSRTTDRAVTFGLKAGAAEDEIVMGRTVGEFAGDVARPVGTAASNVFGAAVGALTGISISSSDTLAATWTPNFRFDWHVGFTTTGRSGWIVQEISNDTWRAQDAAGTAIGSPLVPHFFEAWDVDAAGSVTPNIGATNDIWQFPDMTALPAPFSSAVEGHWGSTASLFFTTVDPATQGFIRRNPATPSGDLLSSLTAPAALGLGIARLHRFAQGTWDSTGAVSTHDGLAGP